jgi:anti-sigma regulatory factor (Ser/Thr protein kinase)
MPAVMSAGIAIDRRLPHAATSIAEARRALEPLARAVDPTTYETLRLLVSELVTNSVRHSQAASDADIELSIRAFRERIRAEICDHGEGFEAVGREDDADEESGWGLHLVEVLSDRWAAKGNGRTCVWFELFDLGAVRAGHGERRVSSRLTLPRSATAFSMRGRGKTSATRPCRA